ncbi:MAG TPA: hypothetical protein VFY15_07045 [Acidimicrobiia bacterium]|nr:hypothetical protein [Acidimicrobiia bacterium]
MTNPIAAAVDGGDLDALVRLVDGLASAREWERIVELRDRCRHALERGLQLWPAAEYAEYRLALEAPGQFAGPVVTPTAGRFALGPLWEVAASTHDWRGLVPHLPSGPARALVAHERVLRGEDLRADASIDPDVVEVPLVVAPWEPQYPLATYRASQAEFPSPPPPAMGPWKLPSGGAARGETAAVEALLALALPWQEQSNGRVEAIEVEGDALAAVAALEPGDVIGAAITAAEAMAWMAWTGASGGAYARRRGSPLGRFAAWWVVAMVCDLDWPVDGGEIGAAAGRLEWHRWEPVGATHGWSASLAVADASKGLGWALYAVDDTRQAEAVGS